MNNLEKLLYRVAEFDFDELLRNIYKRGSTKHFIINLNTEEQLRKGVNTEGDILGFYKSFPYASKKQSLGGRKATFGVVDLYLTGKFYDTFEVVADKKGFIIRAKTDLYDRGDFELIYGNVVGLTDESIKTLQEYLLQIIIKEFKKETLG